MQSKITTNAKIKIHKSIKKNNYKRTVCSVNDKQFHAKRSNYPVQFQRALNIVFSLAMTVMFSPVLFLMRLDDYLEDMCHGSQV